MKRTYFLTAPMVLIFLLLLPLLTFADEKKPDYVVFRGGVYSPEHDDVKDYFDPNVHLELGYGTWATKYFGAEGGIGFFQTRSNEDLGVKVWVKWIDLYFNGKVRYVDGPFEIYGGAGMGVYFSKAEGSFNGISESNTEAFYGFQVVAGGNLDITKDYFLGLEGKYIVTKLDEPDIHFDGFAVSANIGTRF